MSERVLRAIAILVAAPPQPNLTFFLQYKEREPKTKCTIRFLAALRVLEEWMAHTKSVVLVSVGIKQKQILLLWVSELLFAASRKGSVGVVHFAESVEELDFILANGTSPPYIPVIPTALFTVGVAKKILASDVISGLLLYKQNGTQLPYFTHEKSCPNDLSNLNNTCSIDWNEFGTGLNYFDFPFPIFYAKQPDDVVKIKNCFGKFNNYSYEYHNERSLCALEINSFMFATTDTPTCLRRSNSVLNVNPVKFCDPLAGDNVWATLFPIAGVNQTRADREQTWIVLAARLDTTSLFYEIMPGATNPITSIVALLSTAQMLKRMFQNNPNKYSNIYKKNVRLLWYHYCLL